MLLIPMYSITVYYIHETLLYIFAFIDMSVCTGVQYNKGMITILVGPNITQIRFTGRISYI